MELAIVTACNRRLMAKRPPPDEAEAERLLIDLRQIGPNKTIGYLPFYTIRKFLQLSPEVIAADAAARGLASQLFGPAKCCIKSGALYVYDRKGLAQLLVTHADILEPRTCRSTPIASWLGSPRSGSSQTILPMP